jgi:hypothetical protein
MRIAFYGLLLANLGLFAAAQWFAPAQPASAPAATRAAAAVPGATARKILLASERPAAPAAPSTATLEAGSGSATAAGATEDASSTPAEPSAAAGAGPDPAGQNPNGAPAATTIPVAATGTALPQAGAAQAGLRSCVSLGPFRELDIAAAATAMLKKDGYEPRQRPANGAVPDDYLVVVGGLRSETEQQRIVRRLNRGGLDDAFPLPKLDDGYAVSVGVFSEAKRAERRRLAVGRMGVESKVLERTRPGTVYWLDVDMKPAAPGAPDPAAAWLKPGDPAQTLQVVACPQPGTVG